MLISFSIKSWDVKVASPELKMSLPLNFLIISFPHYLNFHILYLLQQQMDDIFPMFVLKIF